MSSRYATGSAALIVTADQGRIFSMMGQGEGNLLITGTQTEGKWWMGRFREDPGFTTVLHRHPKTEEYFYVLDGVLALFVDGAWRDLVAGTLAVIPKGIPHAQANHSANPVTFLGAGQPAAFEKMFSLMEKWLAAGIKPGTPQMLSAQAAAAEECDVELLGPPPLRT